MIEVEIISWEFDVDNAERTAVPLLLSDETDLDAEELGDVVSESLEDLTSCIL